MLTPRFFCGFCHRPCTPRKVDYGIGRYDYGGAIGVDVDEHWRSDCCESVLLDATGNTYSDKDIETLRRQYHDDAI